MDDRAPLIVSRNTWKGCAHAGINVLPGGNQKRWGHARRKAGVTRLVVELAGLGVQGGSLLDGAEAGDAEGLTGLGDGLSPAADVLVLALAEGVAGFGHDLAVLVLHQARGG